MKLNYKKTICVGFVFFLIMAFWQAYDTIMPKILTDKFGMSQTWSGAIMAFDNVLALFLLPFFGALSDRCRSKLGRRTPFIIIGTIAAVIGFMSLSYVDSQQLANVEVVSGEDRAATLEFLYDYDYGDELVTPSGEKFTVQEKFTREEFVNIPLQTEKVDSRTGEIVVDKNGDAKMVTNPDYTNYVVPARQAYVRSQTAESPANLLFFMGLLLVVLVSMSVFRSPAVALMPDVTVKPLRSKGNAVINLMGSFGGILVLLIGSVMGTGSVANDMMSYTVFFGIVSVVMIIALVVFLMTVNEKKLVAEMEEDSRKYGIDESEEDGSSGGKLSRSELVSLILILASVVLWYMGYNAVSSKYSVYAGKVLALDYNMTLIIAQGAAIISYLPVGIISSKLGRKKMILVGIAILAAAFGSAIFITERSPILLMNALFALAGIGWATINVNSFPMVVELSRKGDVGKYTGFYYTASMAAQTVTPILSGVFLDIKLTYLFPYAVIFVLGSFVTMLFVKHGDSKPEAPKSGLEALDVVD